MLYFFSVFFRLDRLKNLDYILSAFLAKKSFKKNAVSESEKKFLFLKVIGVIQI